MAAGSAIQIPTRLPLLLTHESVLLPGSTMRTSVDSPRNMQLVRSRLLKGTSLRSTIIGVIPNTSDPTSDCDDLPNLHRCGSALSPCRPRGLRAPRSPARLPAVGSPWVHPEVPGTGWPEGKLEQRLRCTSKIKRKNAALGLSQLLAIAFFT